MSGFEKKWSLKLSKSELMERFRFTDDLEKERCSLYLDLKGITYHIIIANHIGLDEDGRIKYKIVSDMSKYDKRLRNIIYKFISAFEEQIRGFIANCYINNDETLILTDKINKSLENEGGNIALELEELTFNELLNLVKDLSKDNLEKLFPNHNKHLADNLKAVRELRNAISHHRLLLLYEEFENCYVDGKSDNDLTTNIKNLINLINDFYKNFLTSEINNAIIEKDDYAFPIPEKFIVKI